MTTRDQLEASIAECLTRLSDADMQRVAEDYARIRFPERFPRFDFRAFSAEGKTRKGWPDAWIEVGGQIDGVEATGAKDKSAVLAHLQEDLEKARQRGLAGLVIVSGHPGVQPTHEELTAWRQRFIAEAGIGSDRIHLVFGAALVAELAGPEFARTRIEILKLDHAPKQFKLVHPKRGPDERRLSDFIPSDDDYAQGRVHRPAAADQVLDQLDRNRCALVRGVGASGKSVLAWLLALEAAAQRRPAYLLDLADYADAPPGTDSALVEDLHRFGNPKALFILDNCHLEESLAKEVVLAWQALMPSQQPRLLLLGRELHTSRGSLIDGLRIEPLTLKARQPEVRGVYRRLAWRHSGDQPPPEPPPEVLDQWVGTFGGDPDSPDTTTDLIAFSAAVRGQMRDLLKGRWALSEADAIHEVRSVYLDKISEGETRNLMRLCVMGELDLALAEAALADPSKAFVQCSQRLGLVFRQTIGPSGQYVRYRLAHTALGRLILRAAIDPPDPAVERRRLVLQDSHSGSSVIQRLASTGRLSEARQLADEVLTRPEWLLEIGSLSWVHQFLLLILRLGLSLPAGLGESLTAQPMRRRLIKRALETQLSDLATFLGYAARTKELEATFAIIAEDLTRPENRNELTKSFEAAPLDQVVSVLKSEVAVELWETVFKDVDAVRWDYARRNEYSPKLDAFYVFQEIAITKGRPELAEAPALRLLANPSQEEWHRPGINLRHLSCVLEAARGAPRADVEEALARVATPDWVDHWLRDAGTGGLAGSLLRLAVTLEPIQHWRFGREALEHRLLRELSRPFPRDHETLAQALSLLGASRAVGLVGPVQGAIWPGAWDLARIMEKRLPDAGATTIDHKQVQLWLGLREMARLRPDTVSVPSALARRILYLWQATDASELGQGLPRHVRALNAGMIAWLRQCQAAGWRLVPPDTPSAASNPPEGT